MHRSATYDPSKTWFGARMVDRTRRNHGLEHATVTLLSRRDPNRRLAGRSTPNGYYIYGKVDADELRAIASEALGRLKAGEVELAIHPNCGTNLIAKGLAAGLTSYLGFLGANTTRSRFTRLPRVAILSSLALMFAQPLGLALQKHITTSGEIRDMRIVAIKRSEGGGIVTHFVSTAG